MSILSRRTLVPVCLLAMAAAAPAVAAGTGANPIAQPTREVARGSNAVFNTTTDATFAPKPCYWTGYWTWRTDTRTWRWTWVWIPDGGPWYPS